MLRVTLDTNIYISAFQFGGKAATLLQMALDGEVEVAISRSIIEETVRVLREKFGWRKSDLDGAVSIIESCTKLVDPSQRLNVVLSDPEDNRIIECAVAAGSQAIVTGDKDLLRLKTYEGISILRLREYLEHAVKGPSS